jgi:hypothetical protein
MLFVPQYQPKFAMVYGGVPVYMQGWFTDIFANRINALNVTVVENDEVVGSLTVSRYRNPLGLKQAYDLPWARVGGPVVDEEIDPIRRARIVRQLIDQLPYDRSYFLTLSNKRDFRTFLAAGFTADVENNFTIPAEQAMTWELGLSKMTRRHLRKASRDLVVSTLDPEEFIELYARYLSMRRRKPYAELSIARDILVEATRRGQARIIVARRQDTGEIEAATACLLDDSNYHYWMTTRRPPADGQRAPHQGAIKLLLSTAIRDAHARGLTFDFDGAPSDKEQIARLYVGMGATRTVRYKVKRETTCEKFASLVRLPVKRALGKTFGRFLTLKLNY